MAYDARMLLFPVALVAAAVPAQAESFRIPQAGAPAFDVALQPGWDGRYDDSNNLLLSNADRSVAMTFAVVENDPKDPFTTVQLAQALFEVLGAPPYQRVETTRVDGLAGEMFIGTFKRDDGLELDLRVVIVKVGPQHLAVSSIITQTGREGDLLQQGQAQLAKARIIRR